ncbi:MAG: hypothetical protein NTZ16_02575, partial [Verrucomicrobia bacterium]|nr:hypothetical protein [Verrucomicrobiota bacterium]
MKNEDGRLMMEDGTAAALPSSILHPPSSILHPPSSPQKRRAVIDIGTNSVKLLVATVTGDDVRPIHETSKQTRLGKGFYETHLLQSEAIAQTAAAVKTFATIAR